MPSSAAVWCLIPVPVQYGINTVTVPVQYFRRLFNPGKAEFPFGASRHRKALPARNHTSPPVKPAG
jgi:hypothetical protein